ncbi:hypothetical protein Ahy_A09g043133 isoform D [Arachis hypogaea]|uniref:Uncharacterized protein n=1 Tax=Arachis hypogaea TaxID=3818 RepID=A0A445BHK5_ARAHY|nr:hypothetical protein Ahy_A09g043133 isoform D [Arachis hypogaea]
MEIKRMKEDVRAAREKNGVYISHERFAKEEAEKKAKDERIEQIENDLSLSQKEKLEKTSNSLRDLQENYRMVVSTLKEKEYTISKLLKSGEIQGAYQIKITTTALILLLASRHNELTRVNILGHLIKSNVRITTRSKAKSASNQWVMLPFSTKEKFKVLIIVVENDEFFPRGRSTLMNVDDVIIETSLGRSI